MEQFKNIFEVRKALRFELKPYTINRDVKPIYSNEKEYLLKNFSESYKNFIDLLWQSFYKKEEIIEWYKTIQFQYKWLEELFINDWIENRKTIKFDKNNKKKQTNYITFWDLWDNNFIKKFFENFIKNSEIYLKELIIDIDKWLEMKSRKSDILFLVQKINTRDHLWILYTLFEKNYILHKNDSSIIDKLKLSIWNVRENIEKLLLELRDKQAIEHISLNYYSVNKTPKELTEDIKTKLKENNIEKKYKWTFENENNFKENEKSLVKTFYLKNNEITTLEIIQCELIEEIDIKELKEKLKLFKARQKAWFLQLLQSWKSYNTVWDKEKNYFFTFDFEFMWETFYNFQITLCSDISKENYDKMLNLTNQIEKENNKEKRTSLKMQRWKFFQYELKKFKNFSEAYKKVAQKYWKDSAEVKSLEREKIDAKKIRWWWFLSKEDDDYYINTFDIENSKQVFKEIKNLKENWNDIKIYTFSSITLRALDKLCFKKDSSFIKNIDTKEFNEKVIVNEWKWNEKSFFRLKWKRKLLEEWKLLDFYIYILKNQTALNIKYRSEKSLEILRNSKNIENFEINLKLETYELISKNILKQTFEEILKNNKWNSYKITSYDLEKWLESKKYTSWWLDFWKKENKNDKYIIRINPELTIFFIEKKENFKKENPEIKNNRRLDDRYLLSTNFSFHSNKSYIDSAFINEENRKSSIEIFNEIFNNKNKLDFFYWLDKWTNELITLWIFKKNWERLNSINISEKIPIYKITNKWLPHFEFIKDEKWEFILDEKTWKKKKRYLAKNVSYFIKDLKNEELFEKIEIHSCLWDLSYAKLIKWNIILNADIFTTLNLCKIAAKRFLNDAITKWNFNWEKVSYNEKEKYFYYKYSNKWEINNQIILYWKDEFNFLPFKENYKNLKEEIEEELNQYIKEIKLFLQDSKKYSQFNNEDISIQKINNYKNAISANIVWIIMELQKYFNWYIGFETLDESQILNKWFDTFIWNVINEKIYNRLQLNLEVPPILKKFRTDIWAKEIIQHGKVIYINEKNTSTACPLCNTTLLKKNKNWNLVDKDDKEIYKLWWHLSDFENEMKHLTNDEYNSLYTTNANFRKNHSNDKWNKKENKYLEWYINWKNCDFYLQNPNYPEFNFIKSWDDLATYNIAKKWLEYLDDLSEHIEIYNSIKDRLDDNSFVDWNTILKNL